MPEMSEYSAVAAVHTLWLAARAAGTAWDGSPSLILERSLPSSKSLLTGS
jgi:hypothetical protein